MANMNSSLNSPQTDNNSSDNSASISNLKQHFNQSIIAGTVTLIPATISFFILDYLRHSGCKTYGFELAMFCFTLLSLGFLCHRAYIYKSATSIIESADTMSDIKTSQQPTTVVIAFVFCSLVLSIIMISRLGNNVPYSNANTNVSTTTQSTLSQTTTTQATSSQSSTIQEETEFVYTDHTIKEGVYYDHSNSHTCSNCSKIAHYSILGLNGTPAVWYCQEHYDDIVELATQLHETPTTRYTTTKAYANHTCEVCGRSAKHAIKGISGAPEYYCDQHYREMMDMYVSMFYPEYY